MRYLPFLLALIWVFGLEPSDPCAEPMNRMVSAEGRSCRDASRVKPPNPVAQVNNSPRWLIENYLMQDFTSVDQRMAWIRVAEKAKANDGILFVDIELSILRELNKFFGDKNLITAMANKHKEILETTLRLTLAKQGFLSDPFLYSDYKSYRMALNVKDLPAKDLLPFEKDLGLAFEAANQIFSQYLIHNGLVKTKHNSQHWFRGGLGRTADEANFAARVSREIMGRNRLRKFSDADIQEHLSVAQQWAEKFRREFLNEFSDTGLFITTEKGVSIPSLEVFELLRRVEDPEDLRLALIAKLGNNELNQKLTVVLVEKLQTYKLLVDTFSPPLRNAERNVASLENAEQGGLSADFSGLGAQNLQGTAEALALSKDLTSLLLNVRIAEQEVTNRFKAQLEKFDEVVRSYLASSTASGDDYVGIALRALSLADKKRLMRDLARLTADSKKRIAFIGSGVLKKDRNLLAAHGEMLEKEIRLRIEGKMTKHKLERWVFALDMQGLEAGTGAVQLIVGSIDSIRPTLKEVGLLNQALIEAIDVMNSGEMQQGKTQYKFLY